jgi:hypothetical protein
MTLGGMSAAWAVFAVAALVVILWPTTRAWLVTGRRTVG